MSFPMRRYDLDKTGYSPNNQVVGEEHVLGPKAGPYHPIAPYYGPFYYERDRLTVYVNNVPVEFGEKFVAVNLIQDATAEFNGEVCEVLMVKDCQEGDVVTIDYQCLGGLYQNHAKGMVDLYQAFLADNRPIDFITGLVNKPDSYPPAYHVHFLNEVVGWEAVIVAIERLINALTLRNVPAFEALVDWVMAREIEVISQEEILKVISVNKLINYDRMLLAARNLNFNAIRLLPRSLTVKPQEFLVVDVESTNFVIGDTYYWSIVHEETTPEMFERSEGAFRVDRQDNLFVIKPKREVTLDKPVSFKVRITRNSVDGYELARTDTLYIEYTKIWDLDYGLLKNGIWSIPTTLHSGLVMPTAESMFLVIDDYFFESK